MQPGAVIGGKYRIERALAKGGMGSVWVARHVQLGSPLAIKFLDASFAVSPAHRARFEREARASANLKSPHVVQVTDYGFEGDSPYLVMELLEGEDLGQRLHRVKRMSLRDTAKLLSQVGKALRKAHEAGIAHRDLKPANLFIARVDDEEVVKVLDFGIAKESNSVLGDATRTGEVIGSPHYMSPEQVRAEKDLDYRTDLWSLAIILFRMLTGVLPFPGDQLGPVLAKILTDPIPVPTQIAPDLPHSLDPFFARAMARDKNQRFQSIGEMVEAFVNAAGGKDAFPSISMVLGASGQVPTAGGTAMWVPPGQTGASGVHGTGPQTGGGSTGPYTGPISSTAPQIAGFPGTGPQAAAIAGTGPHTGPQMGTHGGPVMGPATTAGLASTGAPAPSKGSGAVVAIIAVAVLGIAGATGGFYFMSSRGAEPAAGSSASATAATATSAPTATAPEIPTPTATAPATASAAPDPSAAASASSSATAAPKATGSTTARPKGTAAPAGTKTKEKWF